MTINYEAWFRSELERYDLIVAAVYAFVKNRTDDVSIGVGRIIQPIEVCTECGGENDWSQSKMCSCWSEITEDDFGQLDAMGITIETPTEPDE